MTLKNLSKAPFPYFGGKTDAAPIVWQALGDPAHYVEPFAGSLAVLLLRPHVCNRPYYSETVNDLDGLLCNAWRSMALSPDATAEAASWPVSECDLHARHQHLNRWRADPDNVARLMGTVDWCDLVAAGFWIWGQSCWIGSGWCSGRGPWVADEGGRLVRVGRGAGAAKRQLPHLGSDGQGVNHAGAREPGVGGASRKRPHLGDNGQGVNRPQAREPGVGAKRVLPHLTNGNGVNHAGAREPGVGGAWRKLPHLGDDGKGVNRPQAREPGVGGAPPAHDPDRLVSDDTEFHPMTMPEIRRWFQFLSARLRHVRILCGDWQRAVTTGATLTLPVRQGKGLCGVFLDPPYSGAVRDGNIYAHDSDDVATAVRSWCLSHGDDERYRIVLAGFVGEGHEALEGAGWRVVEWYKRGFLKGGMANTGGGNDKQKQERLWLSPHCLPVGDAVPAVADDCDGYEQPRLL